MRSSRYREPAQSPVCGDRERGSSAVEFALTLPLILALFIGMTDIARGINSYMIIVGATRDTARFAIRGEPSDSTLVALAAKSTARLPTPVPTTCTTGQAGICVTRSTLNGTNAVTVRICYDQQLLIKMPGVLSDPLPICAKTTMRVLS